MAESLRQADISHMDLLAPDASKFSSIVEMIVASFKIDFPLRTLLEVVHGPIATFGRTRQCCSCEFGQTSRRVLSRFHSCELRLDHVGAGASGPSREIRRRMVLNSRRGMATSAI